MAHCTKLTTARTKAVSRLGVYWKGLYFWFVLFEGRSSLVGPGRAWQGSKIDVPYDCEV